MRKILIASIAAVAATCGAFAASSSGRVSDRNNDTRLQKALGNRVVAGQPLTCIPFREVENTRVVADDLILYEGRGGKAWLNQTNGPCGLKPYLSTKRNGFGNSICAGEIINVVDARTNTPRGSCGLGEFTPYERARR